MRYVNRKNEITMSRGDNETLTLYTTNKHVCEIWRPSEDDKVYLGIMEANQDFENAIVKKAYDSSVVGVLDDTIVIKIKLDSLDTEFLREGTYYYTIKMWLKDNDLTETLVNRTKLVLIN